MILSNLRTKEDFENLKEGDLLICKFKGKKVSAHNIIENKPSDKEIILEKKDSLYFNYSMYIIGRSNLESLILVK